MKKLSAAGPQVKRLMFPVLLCLILFSSCGIDDDLHVSGVTLPAVVFAEPTLRFAAFGDAGEANSNLTAVAGIMAAESSDDPLDFVLLLGDNFYNYGVSSPVDSQWQTVYTEIYDFDRLPRFYPVLGNHDHYGDPIAQIEYSELDDTWIMPSLFYDFSYELPEGSVRFIGIDTQLIVTGHPLANTQLTWFEERLESAAGGRIIVFAHHPLYTNGLHADSGDKLVLRDLLLPLLTAYGVDLYLAGHDHDIEVFDPGEGAIHVVSGAVSRPRDLVVEGAAEAPLYPSADIVAGEQIGGLIVSVTSSGLLLEVLLVDGSRPFSLSVDW
jgi:tartrate-resistant acid phosphatase type 5